MIIGLITTHKMKLKYPIICICEPYTCGPNLGLMENFKYRSSRLSFNEEIKLGFSTKDDMFDRQRVEYYIVYQGKRPKIDNKLKFYTIECDD